MVSTIMDRKFRPPAVRLQERLTFTMLSNHSSVYYDVAYGALSITVTKSCTLAATGC